MFGDDFMDVPIVEVSMDGTLDPAKNWALGEAVAKLRCVTATSSPDATDAHIIISVGKNKYLS